MRDTVIVAGALAQRPRHGGHAWVFLQYLLGFERLGYDVHFVDRLDPGMPVEEGVRHVGDLMGSVGLGDRWTILLGDDDVAGRPRSDAVELARRSVLLLNVMGYLGDEEILAAAPLRVFLDIDPGFGQMWQDLGLARVFDGHDRHVTVGMQVGLPGSAVPTCGIDWVRMLPPVELSQWPAVDLPERTRFTSVVSWRGPFGPIEHGGRTYGLRVHEFRRFVDLPQRTKGDGPLSCTSAREGSVPDFAFEVALDIDDADHADRQRLEEHGWRLVDPLAAAGDTRRYRDYVQGSAAELMIAKNLYVDTRGGWFSDRSACYLASGRPALVQDTGLDGVLPLGEGLVPFSTPDEAAEGARAILGDLARHGQAARALAEEHLAAERVLPRLLADLGVA